MCMCTIDLYMGEKDQYTGEKDLYIGEKDLQKSPTTKTMSGSKPSKVKCLWGRSL